MYNNSFTRKAKLRRCMALSAQIHYLRRAKAKAHHSEQVGNSTPASNVVAVQLASLKHKFYKTGCNSVRRGLRFMRLAVNVFSELFELPHRKHLLRPQENVAYPQVAPNINSQVENVPQKVEKPKGRTAEEAQE